VNELNQQHYPQPKEGRQPEVWAFILAGGTGQRYSKSDNKLLLPLLGQPVLWWSVKAFMETPCIDGVVISAHPDFQQNYQQVLLDIIQTSGKPVLWASGGHTRRDSVYSALQRLLKEYLMSEVNNESKDPVVSVHDAARPLVTPKDIEKSLLPLMTKNTLPIAGTVLGKALIDTIKRLRTNKEIVETINREEHWAAQTPQNFPLSLLFKAHQAVSKDALITDDAQLVELAQLGRVLAIEADDENLKLTQPQDFAYCEWVLKRRQATLSSLL
jgi:2-C-methyl-D-erythritol 4-phosphate cytidylyltransferase